MSVWISCATVVLVLYRRYCGGQGHSKTRDLDTVDLLEHLPALQQLLYRLIGCQVNLQPRVHCADMGTLFWLPSPPLGRMRTFAIAKRTN